MGYEKNKSLSGGRNVRSKSSAKGTRFEYNEMRFARIELNEQHKEAFRSYEASGEFDGLTVSDLLSGVDTISFSRGDDGKTVTCTASCFRGDHPNGGLRLTGKGGDAERALAVLAYKIIYMVADGTWREAEDRLGGSFDDIG